MEIEEMDVRKEVPFRVMPAECDGDLICPICGEPWDKAGVYGSLRGEGDMTKEEAELFLNGWGCPACREMIPHRLSDVEDCFDFLYKFRDSIEYLEYLNLFAGEYNRIRDCIRTIDDMLERIYSKLEEEQKRITKS
jgi:hypothetical protein